ncbi:MAG: LuxR family transcriptional regulator [Pseudomonadota bacterium]
MGAGTKRWEQTVDFTQKIQQTTSVEGICDHLIDLTKNYGLDRLIAGTIPAPHLSPSEQKSNILFAGWPQDWMRHYVNQSYAYVDPILYRVTTAPGTAFSWRDTSPPPGREVSSKRMMNEAAEHGLKEGFAVPLVTLEGDLATVSFGGEAMDLPQEAAGLIHLVAIFAIGRAFQLQSQSELKFDPLTQRELDVLKWCAEGKTDWEVSVILGIGESTVRSHINSAMGKFSCGNRTALVVNAIRAGLIH